MKRFLGNATQARIRDIAGSASLGRVQARMAEGYALHDDDTPTTWANVSFTRHDGPAEITINRHFSGDEAEQLEKLLRDFIVANDERQRALKEAEYQKVRAAQEAARQALTPSVG